MILAKSLLALLCSTACLTSALPSFRSHHGQQDQAAINPKLASILAQKPMHTTALMAGAAAAVAAAVTTPTAKAHEAVKPQKTPINAKDPVDRIEVPVRLSSLSVGKLGNGEL